LKSIITVFYYSAVKTKSLFQFLLCNSFVVFWHNVLDSHRFAITIYLQSSTFRFTVLLSVIIIMHKVSNWIN